MYCHFCAEKVSDSTLFCPNCGTPLQKKAIETFLESSSAPQNHEPQPAPVAYGEGATQVYANAFPGATIQQVAPSSQPSMQTQVPFVPQPMYVLQPVPIYAMPPQAPIMVATPPQTAPQPAVVAHPATQDVSVSISAPSTPPTPVVAESIATATISPTKSQHVPPPMATPQPDSNEQDKPLMGFDGTDITDAMITAQYASAPTPPTPTIPSAPPSDVVAPHTPRTNQAPIPAKKQKKPKPLRRKKCDEQSSPVLETETSPASPLFTNAYHPDETTNVMSLRHHNMYGAAPGYRSFSAAIKSFFSHYFTYNDRASRSEYWWSTLFLLLLYVGIGAFSVIANIVGAHLALTAYSSTSGDAWHIAASVVPILTAMAMFSPSLSVTIRRLHDIEKSGYYYFFGLIPIVGPIIILVWLLKGGDSI